MTVGHRPRVGRASRRIALLGASALLFALLPGGVAFAEHFEDTTVLDADSATEASVNWSQFTFDSADDAIIGRNDKFPDNLASSVIQGTEDAPLLLTDSDSLSEEVADELERLGVENVHVLGGEEAISEDVIDELEDLGYDTHREAGETRIETAIAIAEAHAPDATEGLLVRAFGDAQGDETRAWADALAAGGWAAEEGIPVFLTQTEELNDNLREYLEGSDIEQLTIVGGTGAVSAAVASELEGMGIEVDRVSGSNRFATAVAVAEARGFGDAGDAEEVILSEGQASDAWAGGFTAAAYSARSGAPIVLSNGPDVPPETAEFLEGAEGSGDVALVCGPLVEPEACAEAAEILGHEEAAHGNEDFDATPTEAATNTVSTTGDPNTNRGARTYTISGLDPAAQYDIALLPADRSTRGQDDVVSFRDTEGTAATTDDNNQADDICESTNYDAVNGDPDGALIETVNGADVTDAKCVNNVTATNGTITFVVDSEDQDSAVPIVYRDADNDNQLDLDANNQPSEEFVVAGMKTWVPGEATSGEPDTDENVTSVDKAGDFFVTDGGAGADATYFYDANDRFEIYNTATAACIQVSQATFEQNLSTGDVLDAASVYNADPAFQSTFCIEDNNPAAPTNVNATAVDNDTVNVSWTPAAGTPEAYRVYRATDTNQANGTPDCPATASPATGYTQIAEVDDEVQSYTDNGLAATTEYCYAVSTVDDGDESALSNADHAETTAGAETTRPRSEDVELTTSGGFANRLDAGDVIKACFNEAMRAPDAGDAIEVTDGDGDIATLTNGGNATFALGTGSTTDVNAGGDNPTQCPAAQTIVITITGAVTDANSGAGNNIVEIPATVTDSAGVTDIAGNNWDLANSFDKVIDTEAGAEANADTEGPAVTSSSVSEPTNNNNVLDTADVITVVFDENMVFTAGDEIVVSDGTDADAIDLVAACGAANAGDTDDTATFAGSGTNTLTLTLCEAVEDADAPVGIPATMTGQTGIDDGEGQNWNPAAPAGQDNTLNEA